VFDILFSLGQLLFDAAGAAGRVLEESRRAELRAFEDRVMEGRSLELDKVALAHDIIVDFQVVDLIDLDSAYATIRREREKMIRATSATLALESQGRKFTYRAE